MGEGPDVSETEWRAQIDPFVERLVRAGGSVLHLHHDVFDRYVVMSDPEGNEFCVC
ncbi:putative enzyme related to lactoylglutathione lyase [Actinopolymorpha pittospori]|uniref:Enzyme related to lactoylglutathione lyase n=1 Tax=Actinopolymorpha pittospori TaxID=648752 RepID=A0A927RHZ3_9ACTN|nr:putative enzyme related to lactoylglutathione lyase [Actinopolymorpha pittospori]